MIDGWLARKIKTLYRDLGWALAMNRENVLSESTLQRLKERFLDVSSELSSQNSRSFTPDVPSASRDVMRGSDPASTIADWLNYLQAFLDQPAVRCDSAVRPSSDKHEPD